MEIRFKQKKAQNELRRDWANFLEKISVEKIEKKNSKNQSEIAASEQKITNEKASLFKHRFLTLLWNQCQKMSRRKTRFSHCTSCFGVTSITTPIWLQKSWKCVNSS